MKNSYLESILVIAQVVKSTHLLTCSFAFMLWTLMLFFPAKTLAESSPWYKSLDYEWGGHLIGRGSVA